MHPHPDSELAQAYLDQALDAADTAAFETRLLADPDLADEVIRLSRADAVITEWAQAALYATDRTRSEPLARGSKFARRLVVAMAATMAMIAIFGIFRPGGDSGKEPGQAVLARIEQLEGDVDVLEPDGSARQAEVGQILFAGQEVRTGGAGSSTVMRWLDSSRLELNAETRVRLEKVAKALPKAFVAEGLVAAEMSTRSHGSTLIVANDATEVRGLAGRLSFATLPEMTFVEADEGEFRVTRRSDGQSIALHRGFYALAVPATPMVPQQFASRFTEPRAIWTDPSGPIPGLVFSHDGKFLVSASWDGSVRRWDLARKGYTGTRQPRGNIRKPLKVLALHPFTEMVAVGGEDRVVRLHDPRDSSEMVVGPTFRNRITALAFSTDGHSLAMAWFTGKESHDIRVLDTFSMQERTCLTDHSAPINAVTYAADGSFATGGQDRTVKLWDAKGHLLRTLPKLPAEVRALAFSPDGKMLVIGCRSGAIRIWDVSAGAFRGRCAGHVREIWSLAFSPDGSMFASGANDETAKLWDACDGTELATIKGHKHAVCAVAFHPNGQYLATGGWDRKIRLWDLPERFKVDE
jgi:WD40 repeat protein